MSNMIFGEYAPQFWAAGLPVIPLHKREKFPVIKAWSQFADRMPTSEEQESWVREFPEGNVGLPLGSTSGLVALDVDTDDPVILGIIEKVFPPSPWKRVGQRGYVMLYKYTGQRGFKIKKSDGTSICDFLSRGQQVVCPPSIHPKTQRPYEANCELLSVVGFVPSLPPNIEEIFKDALRQEGIETAIRGKHKIAEFVSAGTRDNELVRKAGFFAHIVLKGEWTLLEGLENIDAWQDTFVENVHGDDLPAGKGREKLIEMLLKDVFGPKKRTLPAGWDTGLDDAAKAALGLGTLSEDHRRFSADEVSEYITAAVSRIDPKNQTQVMELAEVVCKRIAGNSDISKLQEDAVLRYLSRVTNKELNIVALRKRVQTLKAGEINGTDHKELAEAVLEELSRSGEVRYHMNLLWQWHGSHWKELGEDNIIKLIIQEYGTYPAARKKSDHEGILTTMKRLCHGPLQKVAMEGVNFVNGFLTTDLVLKPHDVDYGMTYVLPYPYDDKLAGKTPMWLGALARYWGNDADFAEKVEALQQAIAVTLFGIASKHHRAFCLYGVAGSGKSQILEIVAGLMPEGCSSSIPPSNWSKDAMRAELAGKLLNVAGELKENEKIEGAIFKQIVVGETVSARRLYQGPFQFRCKAAHWFATNHLPRADDSSKGFTRRWLFFCFNKELEKDTGDQVLDFYQDVLYHERAAIAAWAVQGLVGLRAQGSKYTIPSSHHEQIELVANQGNSVHFFLQCLRQRGQLVVGAEKHEGKSRITSPIDPLYVDYRSFCVSEAAVSPVGSQVFLSRLQELSSEYGFQVVRRDTNGVLVPELKYFTIAGKKAA